MSVNTTVIRNLSRAFASRESLRLGDKMTTLDAICPQLEADADEIDRLRERLSEAERLLLDAYSLVGRNTCASIDNYFARHGGK